MSDRRVALHPWWAPLEPALSAAALRPPALAMQRYMKDVAPFYGIKSPERRALLMAHMDRVGPPALGELAEICRSAFVQREREWQYCAVDLLQRLAKKLGPAHLPLLEELIVTKSWWDTVDLLSSNVAGSILLRHPEGIPEWHCRWTESHDMWLVRAAILYQLKWKEGTNADLLFVTIRRHAAHPEFFIRKAIGWSLRTYARSDPKAVLAFVAEVPLSALSRREALKHL